MCRPYLLRLLAMPQTPCLSSQRYFSLAPMMDWSDTHCRYFWRLMSKKAFLYTEMITTGAILYGNRERALRFHLGENPLALQLGGSDPLALAECARIVEDWGYDEINLNCGCPSDRVQNGMIGACLMARPELVAECVATMANAVRIPITVKHRIGIDDRDNYADLVDFVSQVAAAGCRTFIVHARKAWLKGLSPKENREIPPLQYDKVIQLKRELPHLEIIINGGITSLTQCSDLLQHIDGVMVGREAYSNPFLLAAVDQQLYGSCRPVISREEVFAQYMDYCAEQLAQGVRLQAMARHILGLFQGLPGARQFRQIISEQAPQSGADLMVLQRAIASIDKHRAA